MRSSKAESCELHTLRTQLDYFSALLQHLDTRQVEVIAIDLPGHGESSAPRVDYTADYFTHVVEALLEVCELRDALVVGESIGGSIALALAAKRNPRLARVVALNPYDYGRWGGIRRSSPLANALFTAMLWPGIGSVVARTETKGILRRVLEGGLHDPRNLPTELVHELSRCGALPGHARARSASSGEVGSQLEHATRQSTCRSRSSTARTTGHDQPSAKRTPAPSPALAPRPSRTAATSPASKSRKRSPS